MVKKLCYNLFQVELKKWLDCLDYKWHSPNNGHDIYQKRQTHAGGCRNNRQASIVISKVMNKLTLLRLVHDHVTIEPLHTSADRRCQDRAISIDFSAVLISLITFFVVLCGMFLVEIITWLCYTLLQCFVYDPFIVECVVFLLEFFVCI